MSLAVRIRPLGATELRRRVWHSAPGLLPALLWLVPHRDPLGPLGRSIALLLAAGLGLAVYLGYRRIARPGDAERLPAVAGYAGSVLLAVLLFPGDVEIALVVLAVLAFGDGSATAGGLSFASPPLPWNRRKSWAGFACFLLGGAPAAAFVHWAEAAFNPQSDPASVPAAVSVLVGGGAALAGAVAESVASRVNDNVRVGMAAAIAAALLHLTLVPH